VCVTRRPAHDFADMILPASGREAKSCLRNKGGLSPTPLPDLPTQLYRRAGSGARSRLVPLVKMPSSPFVVPASAGLWRSLFDFHAWWRMKHKDFCRPSYRRHTQCARPDFTTRTGSGWRNCSRRRPCWILPCAAAGKLRRSATSLPTAQALTLRCNGLHGLGALAPSASLEWGWFRKDGD
jgi:hypothetical protein